MGLDDIRKHPRDYLMVFGGLAAMGLMLGVCCWYLGAIQMCEHNHGVLLGTMDCLLEKCIKDYDYFECQPGIYTRKPQTNATLWNLTAS